MESFLLSFIMETHKDYRMHWSIGVGQPSSDMFYPFGHWKPPLKPHRGNTPSHWSLVISRILTLFTWDAYPETSSPNKLTMISMCTGLWSTGHLTTPSFVGRVSLPFSLIEEAQDILPLPSGGGSKMYRYIFDVLLSIWTSFWRPHSVFVLIFV